MGVFSEPGAAQMTQPSLDEASAGDSRLRQVNRAALALGCLLVASGGVCWVAANWPNASAFQKLAGTQFLIVFLVGGALWFTGQTRAYVAAGNHNFSVSAHLTALAGVGCGALLALIGQIYQTGADSWQLFLAWAGLLIPWLLALQTVALALLFALVLNTALALFLDIHGVELWLGFGGWAVSALLVAALNAGLLWIYERFFAGFSDVWRLGPRTLAAALAIWLVLAAFSAIDSHSGPIIYSLTGWAALALMYWIYSSRRADMVIVSVAAIAAFVLLTLPLLYWAGSEAGLLLVVLVLFVAMAIGLRKLGQLLRARQIDSDPWYFSAFRLIAMGVTAVLLIVFLLITLEFDVESLWIPGLVLSLAGVAAYRAGKSDVPQEAGLVLMTAGLLLGGGSLFALHDNGSPIAVYALLVFAAILYAVGSNAAFRFVAAFFVLAVFLIMTWPDKGWDTPLLNPDRNGQPALGVYLRLWWTSVAAVLALLIGRGAIAGKRWRPLGWALAFLAQIMVWFVPAPRPAAVGMGLDPSVMLVWLACAALPVVALTAVLWRRPIVPGVLRFGVPLALAVASVGWMGAPGVSLALLWMVVGFAMRHRSLMGFGALALLACLARFYYQLDTTLLQKSVLLAGTGAWLILSSWMFSRVVASGSASQDGSGPASSSRPEKYDPATFKPASTAVRQRAVRWRFGLACGLLLVLVGANLGIYEREQILGNGRRVVLELAPVDPRSLMQGDYMRLRFAVADDALRQLQQAPDSRDWADERYGSGYLLLRPDDKGIHRLVSIKTSDALEDSRQDNSMSEDVLLKYRLRDRQIHVATDAWFFPEGRASHFEQARYGEFRVDQDGASLLTDLLDADLRSLSAH